MYPLLLEYIDLYIVIIQEVTLALNRYNNYWNLKLQVMCCRWPSFQTSEIYKAFNLDF